MRLRADTGNSCAATGFSCAATSFRCVEGAEVVWAIFSHTCTCTCYICLPCAATGSYGAAKGICCAATGFCCVDNSFRCAAFFLHVLFIFLVVCAPLELRCFTPGYVQAKLDALSLNDLYTMKLQLGRCEKKKEEDPQADPAAADPDEGTTAQPGTSSSTPSTRSSAKATTEDPLADSPVKKAMGYQ